MSTEWQLVCGPLWVKEWISVTCTLFWGNIHEHTWMMTQIPQEDFHFEWEWLLRTDLLFFRSWQQQCIIFIFGIKLHDILVNGIINVLVNTYKSLEMFAKNLKCYVEPLMVMSLLCNIDNTKTQIIHKLS